MVELIVHYFKKKIEPLNKKRIPWIDNVKSVAIFCVIFGHFNGLIFTHGRPGFAFVNLLIVVFNMPLFVLMSGYSNYHSLIKLGNISNLWDYIKKTILHIALPCVIPCIIVWMIYGCKGMVDFKLYWFLVMLFIMQIAAGCAFYISRKIQNNYSEVWGWMLFGIAMFFLNKYGTAELFIYYVLGGVIRSFEVRKKLHYRNIIITRSKFKYALFYSIITIFAFGLFSIVGKYQFYNDTFRSLYAQGLLYIWWLRLICALLFCYLIISITKRLSTNYNVISYVGSKTLGLYIYTSLMIDVCKRLNVMIHDDSWCSWLVALFISISATIIAMIIIEGLENNKITRFCFFGKY